MTPSRRGNLVARHIKPTTVTEEEARVIARAISREYETTSDRVAFKHAFWTEYDATREAYRTFEG